MPYKMKNGRWRGVKMIQGQRKTRLFDTKTEAKKWEAQQDEELWRKQLVTIEETTPIISLHEAATAYLEYSEQRHHHHTFWAKRDALRRFFKLVKPNAGPEVVTNKIALTYIMRRAKEAGNAAANKDRKHMSAFWAHCCKFFGYSGNPFLEVNKLPENSQPHYVPPIEDFWKVYDIADEDDKTMLLSLLYTAGRRSEPFRWTWEDDIDLTARRIRLSTCKTADGSRKYEWLTMPSRLHDALVNHKMRTGGKGHVFRSRRTGEAYVDRKHFIVRLCERAGVRPFNYHGIRGLCASLLAAGNVPMKDIQHVLMHTSMVTTDRYIRRIGGTSDVLAAAFDSFEKRKAGKVMSFAAFQGI